MLFALSKAGFALVSPAALLGLMLILGLALAARRGVKAAIGRCLCAAALLIWLAIAALPVGEWALTPLENRFAATPLPQQVDGVIVIGGDEQTAITAARGTPSAGGDSLNRYIAFAALARRYPDAKLMFSGGPVFFRPDARVIDSDVARDFLTELGVPQDRMTYEKTSRNTYENAIFSADIARPDKSQHWLLVTSAWHMPRAIGCFRRAGWTIDAAPSGYYTTGDYHLHFPFRFSEQLHMLTLAEHEYIGLAAYRLLDRTDALWPK